MYIYCSSSICTVKLNIEIIHLEINLKPFVYNFASGAHNFPVADWNMQMSRRWGICTLKLTSHTICTLFNNVIITPGV